jgi:cysteine desulfurase
MIYLDNAATTKVDPLVIEAMRESLADFWGNPSSAHESGSKAKRRLEEARVQIAALINCYPDEVYFTSGGTEADNWAILGVLDYFRGKKNHFITVATEHHAVIETAEWLEERDYKVTVLGVDSDGRVDPAQIKATFTEQTALVSVMYVNNELGTIQDIAKIGEICHEEGVLFHSDCVQSFGKLPLDFKTMNCDLASISSHKIHGPKGVGALIVRRGTKLSPRTIGGGQERGLRTGTENTPGIIGFGKAAELSRLSLPEESERIRGMRNRLESRILSEIPKSVVNGSRAFRSSAPLNVSFKGCDGEALLIALDRKGFCVSTGSACSAGATGASHVLMALGMSMEDARASLRISFGRFNQESDVDALMDVLPGLVQKQRETSPLKS